MPAASGVLITLIHLHQFVLMSASFDMPVIDQYADGVAARLWSLYIGSKKERTTVYKDWLFGTLRTGGCHNLLDVACGTG